MKYFVRALKYLVYFICLFTVIVTIIWLISPEKAQGMPITAMFKEGSGYKLLIFFVVAAALYPWLGFVKRKVYLNGDYSKYDGLIKKAFSDAGMAVESEDAEKVCFRQEKGSTRFSRMWEDRITVDKKDNPLVIEGYRRDVERMVRSINYAITQQDNPEE